MTRLFRSKSCGVVEFNPSPPSPFFHNGKDKDKDEDKDKAEEDLDSEEEEEEEDYDDDDDDCSNPVSTPFINPGSKADSHGCQSHNQNQFAILDIVLSVLKKSLVTCSVEREDVSSLDISWPMEARHVSHVTFDRFNGFLGLPTELEPEVPTRVPSAR